MIMKIRDDRKPLTDWSDFMDYLSANDKKLITRIVRELNDALNATTTYNTSFTNYKFRNKPI